MDKNAIYKYAVWARNELISRVTQKAEQFEITEKKTTPKDADSINGRLLTDAEKNQRKALIEKIQADGFEQVMEEVAYTWFNRFTALRFMEVNNYLPSHTRVFTNEAGEFKPQILADAIQLDLEGLNMDKVFELKDANKTEELYKYLLITQCNALSGVLPRMFQKIEHYTELLLPDYLLREGSVIEQMITLIPEEDWTDQVQIIGWLYQYYNSEPKDAVFEALKKNVKITKEKIPAATQMFTPDWIVRYMVENSLGRLWLEGHPNDSLKSEWKYYLDEAEQEATVQKQLDEIRKEYAALKPEEIRCIDPCMGSGHILCYMFDVLVKIYEDYGYTAREAVGNIVEKNLWGLDIDDRAAQLSYFAVMMKARQYDRRFLTREIQPHVYAIKESNGITSAPMHDMGIELSQEEYGEAVKQTMRLVEEMRDAKEYGSIIQVTPCNWELLRRFAIPRGVSEGQLRLDIHGEIEASQRLQDLINVGEVLSQKYNAVVTNPPYMGSSGMSPVLANFVKKKFPNAKSDMSTVFMQTAEGMCSENGYYSMINIPVWMTLKSFSKMRESILHERRFIQLVHFGRGVFGSDFGTTAFVISKQYVDGYVGRYKKLYKKQGAVSPLEEKEKLFLEGYGEYYVDQKVFFSIDGAPIAYALNKNLLEIFVNEKKVTDYGTTRLGMTTADNNRFTRLWFEVNREHFIPDARNAQEVLDSGRVWVPYNKGGKFRKWYGNNDCIVYWANDGYDIRNFADDKGHIRSTVPNTEYYFRECLTWSKVTAGSIAFRYRPVGSIFDVAGACLFANKNLHYLLGFLNSNVVSNILAVLSPTLNYEGSHIATLPVVIDNDRKKRIEELVKENIALSKADWDMSEMSWDFQHHPFVKNGFTTVREASEAWLSDCKKRFENLKNNEEEINRHFISIYGLEDELSPDVSDSDITIDNPSLKQGIISFISYAVGCMFGRYSLDDDGLIYAGGLWSETKYKTFMADRDNIIPICDDEYFEDDIVGRFVEFVRVVFGDETLEENLMYISQALGGNGSPREVLRRYFLENYYVDHCSMCSSTGSGKRPMYWLFDSGKNNGFKCLVYMHRYQPDTIARIRTDYVHEQQSRYRTAIADIEQRISGATTSDRVRLNKQLANLQAQATEIRSYEEKIHHLADQMISIDIDDGVRNNYEIFKDVLAKIK